MTKIGSNLKKIRHTKGLSQQAFADVFGITRGNISSYEENRAEPKVEVIIRIANYFSIPLENILTKDLSINEILQYNADKLLEEEQRLANFKLKEIPFINDDILAKVWHHEMDFSSHLEFPKICLPATSLEAMIAISFNENIPHHIQFEQFKLSDVLIFKDLNADNMHLSHDRFGLYLIGDKIKLGKYVMINNQLHLEVNAEIILPIEDFSDFWMINGVYSTSI